MFPLTAILYMIFFIFLFKITIELWKQFFRKDFVWDTNNGRYWAVVTGSSDGIGFEFARQLALKGYNLLMISRTEQKLEDKKQLILNECQNKIQVKTLAVDFKHLDIYEKIARFLDGHDIFVLVNNVGFGPKVMKAYYEEDQKLHQDLLNGNLVSTIRMTDYCLPKMIEKKRGLVINVSSLPSIHCIPQMALYSSLKAFTTHFSRALFYECLPHNVLVFNLLTSSVQTNSFRISNNIIVPTAEQYVRSSLKSINWTSGESYGYIYHQLQSIFLFVLQFIIGYEKKTKYFSIVSKLCFNQVNQFDVTITNITRFTFKYFFGKTKIH